MLIVTDNRNNESLILKAQAEMEAAPFLFCEQDLPKVDRTKPKTNCNGERFWRDEPELYKLMVKLLAEPGVPTQSICRLFNCTDNLVRSVKAREKIPIAHEKQVILSNIAHGAVLATERVIETMGTASVRDALLGTGILIDKLQLLSGEVTARVEHVERIDIFSDFGDFVKTLEAKPVEALEMGLTAQNNFTKGSAAGSPVIDVEMESTSSAALEDAPAAMPVIVPAETTDSVVASADPAPAPLAVVPAETTAAADPAPANPAFDRRARWRAKNRERLRAEACRYREQKGTNES